MARRTTRAGHHGQSDVQLLVGEEEGGAVTEVPAAEGGSPSPPPASLGGMVTMKLEPGVVVTISQKTQEVRAVGGTGGPRVGVMMTVG
jgi:hypothetical protein